MVRLAVSVLVNESCNHFSIPIMSISDILIGVGTRPGEFLTLLLGGILYYPGSYSDVSACFGRSGME